ncbi:hypothetical protein H6F93_00130, partial [Leptolyngbya sp. FACHB-671]|uniref:hypothetical protein n=1 Tax=Leptolyngbya sp. FACHB-671 TaxID=2692812 RepID=UPI00168A26CE
MKINRHDQAKILSPQEIAWLFDGKVGLVSDLKLLRLLGWSGKGEGREAIARGNRLPVVALLYRRVADRARSGVVWYLPLHDCAGQRGM